MTLRQKYPGLITFLVPAKQCYRAQDVIARIRCMVCSHKQLQRDRFQQQMQGLDDDTFICQDCGKPVSQRQCLEQKTHKFYLGLDDRSLLIKEYTRERTVERIQSLIKHQKIILVLDIDNTLLHTIEDTLDKSYQKRSDVFEFQISQTTKHFVKIRNYISQFFASIYQDYEIFFFTQGTRSYAYNMLASIQTVCKDFFDRNKQLREVFNRNIIGREDFFKLDKNNQVVTNKNLSKILPNAERHMLILDDRKDVWQRSDKYDYSQNVIFVKGYYYWQVSQQEMDLAHGHFFQSIQSEVHKSNPCATENSKPVTASGQPQRMELEEPPGNGLQGQAQPTAQPTPQVTAQVTAQLSGEQPTSQVTAQPTSQPTAQVTAQVTAQPSGEQTPAASQERQNCSPLRRSDPLSQSAAEFSQPRSESKQKPEKEEELVSEGAQGKAAKDQAQSEGQQQPLGQ